MTNEIKSWEDRLYPSLIPIIDGIVDSLEDGDIFYDIGANTGLLTQKILEKTNKNIRCFLFEPVQKYYDIIVEKFSDIENVEYFNVALVDEIKDIEISVDNDNLGWNTITSIRKYGNVQNIKGVDISSLIYFYNLPRPNIIKIDVEQSEYLTIKGMKNFLENSKLPRKIFMEIGIDKNNLLWQHEVDMIEYLFSLGYKRFEYDGNNTIDAIFEL